MKKLLFFLIISALILSSLYFFYGKNIFLSPTTNELQVYDESGDIIPVNKCLEDSQDNRCLKEGQDCPDCPPVLVLTINGVNSNTDSHFHRYIWENLPLEIDGRRIDPFNMPFEACWSDVEAQAEEVQEIVDRLKEENPCAKIIVIGHSLGGTLTWFLDNVDCKIFIDPPTDCHRGIGEVFCPSQKGICKSVDGPAGPDNGIKSHPGYIPLDNHNPFENPEENPGDINKINEKINECFENVAPLCNYRLPYFPEDNEDI